MWIKGNKSVCKSLKYSVLAYFSDISRDKNILLHILNAKLLLPIRYKGIAYLNITDFY